MCKTPPSNDTTVASPISVSLNGVDFHFTNFAFNYYEQPILLDMLPKSGKADGGTEINLLGKKFSKITGNMKSAKCRFR